MATRTTVNVNGFEVPTQTRRALERTVSRIRRASVLLAEAAYELGTIEDESWNFTLRQEMKHLGRRSAELEPLGRELERITLPLGYEEDSPQEASA